MNYRVILWFKLAAVWFHDVVVCKREKNRFVPTIGIDVYAVDTRAIIHQPRRHAAYSDRTRYHECITFIVGGRNRRMLAAPRTAQNNIKRKIKSKIN